MINRQIAPAIKDFKEIALTKSEVRRMSNGIELQLINSGEEAVNRLDLIFKGGFYEQRKPLIASLTSTMLKNGSKNYCAKDIAEKLDYYGAWLQTQVFDHHTVISVYSINRCFEEVWEIIESIIRYPVFPDSELDILKSRLLSSLKNDNEKVRYLALKGFNKIYYGENHPLGKEVDEIAVKDVSINDLINFHKEYYNPNNLSIILSGKIEPEMIMKIDNTFCQDQILDRNVDEYTLSIHNRRTDNKNNIINKNGAIQAGIVMGLNAIPRTHEDYIPLRILTTLFGGYFGSRLMASIREDKGYTYGISASLNGKLDSSYIQISTECGVEYTWDLIDAVKAEMKKLRETLVEISELDVVKSYLRSAFAKILDSPFSISDFYLNQIVIGFDSSYFKKHIDYISEITPEKIQEMAQKYFIDENIYLSIAGDENNLKKKKSISC